MSFRFGLESHPIMKDADSPAGHEFVAVRSFADLPDCPRCKFGTIDPVGDPKNNKWACADCGFTFTDKS